MTKREEARLAILVTAAACVFLGGVLVDDILHLFSFFHGVTWNAMFLIIATAIGLGGVGPFLAWSRSRGRAMHVRCSDGAVQAGTLRIRADQVTALSVKHGVRGVSVAVAYGRKKTAFFELERAEDAALLAATLGVEQPPLGEVRIGEPRRALVIPQAMLAVGALAWAPLYYLAATASSVSSSDKGVFGMAGVIFAQLSMVLLLVRRLAPKHALALGRRGAWDTHAALHRAHVEEQERPSEPARLGTLARGDERVGAWLARIDAIPAEQHAYRGGAMKKDVLWETLGDDGAPLDARMGAARVLRRRYGEDEDAIARVVEDRDVRVRVEAACEELDDAEHQIETLGPLFRAR